ncbi:MAG: hypothetical protein HY014_04610 [Acidobacteria bacterium]|nr:hypothetical protein [Acidobacteriota bacterium]MBI3487432.1 hypothetical protein [Acidobacteriota bacterium]
MEPHVSIQAFLQFLTDPPADRVERGLALEQHLDRLAWVRHEMESAFDGRDLPDPPAKDYAATRATLESRFPGFGWYHTVSKVGQEVREAEVGYGDALDDLADIQGDLEEFLWRWEHNSHDDALFHLRTLMPHWMGHVRGLQRFLGDWLW